MELPGGLDLNGEIHTRVTVRGIAGRPWEIWNVDLRQPLERVVSGLLAAATSLDAATLQTATLADRHALVRGAWDADRVGPAQASANCAHCGEWSEFELDLSAVHLPKCGRSFRLLVDGRELECGLPTPEMTEQAVDVTAVVAACLCTDRDTAAPLAEAVEEALAQCDPLGGIVMVGNCVGCGEPLEAQFDLKAAWVARIHRAVTALLADVHILASHYHWTEEEILRIPEARRQAYLNLCEVSGGLEAVS